MHKEIRRDIFAMSKDSKLSALTFHLKKQQTNKQTRQSRFCNVKNFRRVTIYIFFFAISQDIKITSLIVAMSKRTILSSYNRLRLQSDIGHSCKVVFFKRLFYFEIASYGNTMFAK